jgi:hypothetical protein
MATNAYTFGGAGGGGVVVSQLFTNNWVLSFDMYKGCFEMKKMTQIHQISRKKNPQYG